MARPLCASSCLGGQRLNRKTACCASSSAGVLPSMGRLVSRRWSSAGSDSRARIEALASYTAKQCVLAITHCRLFLPPPLAHLDHTMAAAWCKLDHADLIQDMKLQHLPVTHVRYRACSSMHDHVIMQVPGRWLLLGCKPLKTGEERNLHGNDGHIERHERVGREQQVENAGDLRQAGHIVREPGDEPAERKIRGHACAHDVLMQLWIGLSISRNELSMKLIQALERLSIYAMPVMCCREGHYHATPKKSHLAWT